jgi:hypothetical protein
MQLSFTTPEAQERWGRYSSAFPRGNLAERLLSTLPRHDDHGS